MPRPLVEPLSPEGKKIRKEVSKVTGYNPFLIPDLPLPPKDKQFTINGFVPIEEK
jgi:hypothetical protein